MKRTAICWGHADSAAPCARSIHYHRIPPTYWRDRLLRVRALGLNSIEVRSVSVCSAAPCLHPAVLTGLVRSLATECHAVVSQAYPHHALCSLTGAAGVRARRRCMCPGTGMRRSPANLCGAADATSRASWTSRRSWASTWSCARGPMSAPRCGALALSYGLVNIHAMLLFQASVCCYGRLGAYICSGEGNLSFAATLSSCCQRAQRVGIVTAP